MPQQSSSNRKMPESSPDAKKLLEYKHLLQGIRQQISGMDLRKIRERDIAMFIRDLDIILSAFDKLRSKPSISKYLRSPEAVRINIRDVRNELMVIIYMLDKINEPGFGIKDTAEAVREIYQDINLCRGYIDEALSQFLI